MMRAGIDFIVPDDYCHIPDPEFVKAGYFVMTDPKLFPDGIVRKRVMVTDAGIEFLKRLKDEGAFDD